MRKLSQQFAAVGFAFLLVASGLAGVAQIGAVEDRVDQERNDLAQLGESVSPVGSAQAIAPVAAAVGALIVYEGGTALYDYFGSSEGDAVDAADAEQAMIDIYSSASGVTDSSETYLTTVSNYLGDSKEVALMVGKNAAIKAYQNGSTKTQAEIAASEAIRDYYSSRQVVLSQNWDNSVTHLKYLNDVALNESGVTGMSETLTAINPDSQGFIRYNITTYDKNAGTSLIKLAFKGLSNRTVTLVNGTSVDVKKIEVYSDASEIGNTNTEYFGPETGDKDVILDSHEDTAVVAGWEIAASQIDSTYDDLNYLDNSEYSENWNYVQTQSSDAQAEVIQFVNATYDEWGGQINESDLIDPYLGSRSYSPEGDYRAWALRSYTAMGLDSPANLSTFGSMTIVEDSTQVEGILMSGGLPANDTFEVDTVYNASQIEGYQFVVGETETHELEGEFSITNMTNAEGDSMNQTVYRNVTYETANLSEYQAVADEIAELREELEAMKQNAGGGGWTLPSFGFGGLVPGLGVIGLIFVGLAALAILKE